MAINPIAFARAVNEQFLRYQLTAFPLTDEKLARQAEVCGSRREQSSKRSLYSAVLIIPTVSPLNALLTIPSTSSFR